MQIRNSGFNIIPGNEKPHQRKQFGTGVLDLNALSSVILDEDSAVVDMGALHAKSEVERGIKFFADPAEVPHGKTYWIIWVAMDRLDGRSYFAGLTCSELRIDAAARRGYKILVQHVKAMEGALKRRLDLTGLNAAERKTLAEFLQKTQPDAWQQSPPEFHRLLSEVEGTSVR